MGLSVLKSLINRFRTRAHASQTSQTHTHRPQSQEVYDDRANMSKWLGYKGRYEAECGPSSVDRSFRTHSAAYPEPGYEDRPPRVYARTDRIDHPSDRLFAPSTGSGVDFSSKERVDPLPKPRAYSSDRLTVDEIREELEEQF